ncbi:MAG: DUF4422 domain-containing protein [Alphaproteobacteria bacterium]|nr:DUF4422 domain-containing protein [Alphaproteobacteria bacterium]
MVNKTIILVCSHNQQKILETPNIKPILVGAALSHLDIYLYKDNIGENISNKNIEYNELTAQYWAWKNLPQEFNYVGFFHYRRYLALKNTIFPKKFLPGLPGLMSAIFGFDEKNIAKLTQDFDIILPKKTAPLANLKNITMKEHFINNLGIEVFQNIEEIILREFPEMSEAFNVSIIEKNIYFKNIFVMQRKYFNDYMNFLFKVLFSFEEAKQKKHLETKQRVYGFVAEYLLNVYTNHLIITSKNLRIAEYHLLRRYYINIFNLRYFNQQLAKLKKRLSLNYIKYIFSKTAKKG